MIDLTETVSVYTTFYITQKLNYQRQYNLKYVSSQFIIVIKERNFVNYLQVFLDILQFFFYSTSSVNNQTSSN